MERNIVLNQINEIFIDILDNKQIQLSDKTTANDIEEWNSLTHMELVVSIEKHFKIRFSLKEIQSWSNVGEMIDCVLSKKNSHS